MCVYTLTYVFHVCVPSQSMCAWVGIHQCNALHALPLQLRLMHHGACVFVCFLPLSVACVDVNSVL